ncbi:MAG: PAS domain-containing protein, partial [Candidatus Obscuribacterales bacterium]|nr:PAS domain-containing protein [Steroidobacteraceae bacterium]
MRRRSRLLAAAFSLAPPPIPESANRGAESELDLLNALNAAGRNAGVHVWDWDVQRGTLKVNHTIADRYGQDVNEVERNPAELIARSVHPDDRARYRQEFIRALKGESALVIDYRVIPKDGVTRPIRLVGQIQRATSGPNKGRAIRVLGINVDMSSHAEKESRIEAQNEQQIRLLERINLATEAAGIGVWDWDLESGKLSSDTTMSEIFKDADLTGISRAEDFVTQIVHPDDREAFVTHMNAAVSLKGGDRLQTRFRYIRRDGGVHHVQLHGRIVRNEHGVAQRFLGISWNISAQVEADAEVARQTERQKVLLERLDLATEEAEIDVWDWDLVTDRFIAHMPGADRTKQLDIVGGWRLIQRVVHPEDLESFLATLKRGLESGRSVALRYRTILPDGSQRHVQIRARVFRNAAGKAVRILGVSLNVTEEVKHLGELRRQAEGERTLRDRLNLATKTAGISIWDKDMVSGAFVCDEHFWNLFGIATPVENFVVYAGIHPDERDVELASINAALADPDNNDVLSIRHRSSNPRSEPQYVQTHMRVFRNAAGKAIRLLGVTWDVTDQVVHAEELERKAEKERAVVERLNITTQAAGISPWEFDLETTKFTWHGMRQPVYDLDDVPLENYLDALRERIIEEDRAQLTEPTIHALKNKLDNYSYDFRVRSKEGRIHYMHNNVRLLRGAGGRYRYLMGVTLDITNEVEANLRVAQRAEENRQLVERLKLATESAGIASWDVDLVAQRFSSVENPVQALEISAQDFSSMSLEKFNEYVVPEDRAIFADNVRQSLKAKTDRIGHRYRVLGANGSVVHVQTYGRLIVNEQNHPVRALGVSWDITREVLASEQLQRQAMHERELLDRLNVTTQAAGISPWEFDLKTNQYIWFGARLGALGLDQEPLHTYYESLKNILLPEDRDILQDAATEAIENNVEVYSARYRAHGTDGQIHYLKNYVRVLRSPRGTPYRLVGVTWDISEEVAAKDHLQQQVQHAQALKERLGIATMAAGISPWEVDLISEKFLWVENPIAALSSIHGSDNTLATFLQGLHPEDVHNFRDEISRAATGGYDLITYRFRGIAQDGGIVHVKCYAKLYFNEQRQATRALGVSWDVSKEVEAAVRLQSQAEHERRLLERLNIATETAGISSWEIDLVAAKFLWIENPIKSVERENDASTSLATLTDRIVPDDRTTMPNAIKAALAQHTDRIGFRYRSYNSDGSQIVHVQCFARMILDARGRPIRLLGVSWDVTNEVQTNERLQNQAQQERKLLERLNIATDSAGITSWEIDLLEERFLWIENAIKVLVYADDEQLTLAKHSERTVPEDRGVMPDAIRAALAANSDRIGFRYRAVGNDGSIVHLQTFARLILDATGTPVRMLGVSWNITDEVAAAEQLRYQTERLEDVERRLERASLSSSEGHWEAELATGQLWCSSSFRTLLGYTEDELDNRIATLEDLMHEHDRPTYLKAWNEHLTKNAVYDVETRLRTAQGEYRWFRMRGMAERNADGSPIVMAGSIHDMHQQKTVEDALKLAQLRFERAINGTQDGLWELDVSSGNTWCSPRLALLLGFPPQAIEGTNFLVTLVHPEDAPKLKAITTAHYRDNTPFEVEVRLQ